MRYVFLVVVLAGCGSVSRQAISCSQSTSTSGNSSSWMCDADFTCSDNGVTKRFTVRCTGPDGDFACDCLQSGVVEKSFTSVDYCTTQSDRRGAAEVGCGWTLH